MGARPAGKEAWGRFSGKNWEMPRWEGRTARWYREIRSTILFGIRANLTRALLSLAGWFLGLSFKKVFMSVGTKTWNHQDDTMRYDQPLFEIKLKLMGTPLAVYTIYLLEARF